MPEKKKTTSPTPALAAAAASVGPEIKAEFSGEAASLVGHGKRLVEMLADRGATQVKDQLVGRKDTFAVGMLDVSQALLLTGNQLRERGQTDIAGYASDIAEKLGQASGTLRQKELEELLNDAQALARSKPVVVFIGLVLLGFAGARLAKSSARNGA